MHGMKCLKKFNIPRGYSDMEEQKFELQNPAPRASFSLRWLVYRRRYCGQCVAEYEEIWLGKRLNSSIQACKYGGSTNFSG